MLGPVAQGAAAIGNARAPVTDIMVNAIASPARRPPIKISYTLCGRDANGSETHIGSKQGMTGANAAASESPLPRTRAAPIYAVASGKGGVGKTWLSTMLSIAFGRAGQRALLVDCD